MIRSAYHRTGVVALLVVLTAACFVTGCGGQNLAPDAGLIEIQTPKPVVFDTDMAHEDMFAALFLLSHPNVDVKAITVSGTGEAHCGPGVAHALGLVELSGHKDIPVSCGKETPLSGNHVFPATWRQAVDDAYGVEMPSGGMTSPQSASESIIDVVRGSNESITIVAVGPLTNIAEALEIAPEIRANIREIYIMGGAVDVEGNVGNSGVGIQNEYAEWNIYIDPVAANIVFQSGIPITLVPLDATKYVPITRNFYKALDKNRTTPASNLVYELLGANLDFVDSGGFQFWDSLTAAIFTDPGIASFQDMDLVVVEEEGSESGRTKEDASGAKIKVAVGARQDTFEQLFLTILNWKD